MFICAMDFGVKIHVYSLFAFIKFYVMQDYTFQLCLQVVFAAIRRWKRQTEEDKLLQGKIIVAFQSHRKNKFTSVLRSYSLINSKSARNYKLYIFLKTFFSLIQ